MPGFLLHVGAQVKCAHAGLATPTVPNPRVTVSGQPTVTMAATLCRGRLHLAAADGRQRTLRDGAMGHGGDADHLQRSALAVARQPGHLRADGYAVADIGDADTEFTGM